ncbi:hypothetical protein [Kaarinaea lacus]
MSGPKIERKAWVADRTDQHRERLDSLAYEVFNVNIEELVKRELILFTQSIINQFGRPSIRSVEQYDHPDPSDDKHTKIENITWQFEGMLIDVISYPPVENHLPESVQLKRIEISSPKYELKHGIRVGQNYETIAGLLGPPNERSSDKLVYRVEDWQTEGAVTTITSYQINMFLDNAGNIQKIVWMWEGVYH